MKNMVYTKKAVVMTAVVFFLMLALPGSADARQDKEYFKLKNLNKILEKSLDFDFDFDIDLSSLADMDINLKEMARGSQERYKEKYEEKFDKTVALAGDGIVEVGNVSGDVIVKTWNRNEVKIDAVKISRANTQEKAKANADLVKIVVTQEAGLVRVKTEYPKNNRNKNLRVSVSYNLMVPKGSSPSVSTVSGDVVVADIDGDVKANTVSGEVKLGKMGGSVKAKSVSGGVILEGAKNGAHCEVVSGTIEVREVTGDVNVKGVSGDIELSNIRGNVTVGTTSGEILMRNITDAENVRAKILSGDLRYEGDIMRSGVYEFQSHSGDVTLTIPAATAFDLEAKTFSGTIDSDFDLTISGKISKKSIRGKANGGGADIEVQTFSGDVRIRKK